MLSKKQAEMIVRKNLPKGKIQKSIELGDDYIFQVFGTTSPMENELDPFYAVNKTTSKIREYSLFDENPGPEFFEKFGAEGGSNAT